MADTQLATKCFKNSRISTIVQIGCGGTGSLLVPHIARTLLDKKEIRYVLIDGDKVEEKNIKRQNFTESDIGSFKSDALAKRYSRAFGVDIQSVPKYLVDDSILNEYRFNTLIVGCVDNNKTREILRSFRERFQSTWVDSGNELLGGQIFISGVVDTYSETDIIKIHPEMANKKDKLPTELSCAERVNSGEQSLGVNLTASTLLFNVVNSFIRGQKVYYYEIDFTAKNSFTKKMLDAYPLEGNPVPF